MVVGEAPTLEVPVGFEALSDDLVLRAWLRAPFVTHGTLAAVCARFKSLLRSDTFGKLRRLLARVHQRPLADMTAVVLEHLLTCLQAIWDVLVEKG